MAHNYITRLTHCTFCCKDYAKMVEFYEEILGLEKMFTINFEQDIIDGYIEKGYPLTAKPGDEWITYMKVAPKEFIELFHVPYHGENDTKNQEFHHVCLIVEDIAEAAADLRNKGLRLWRGPIWMNDEITGPYDGSEIGQCGSKGFYIQDPEGNEIELMQYTENSLQILNDYD